MADLSSADEKKSTEDAFMDKLITGSYIDNSVYAEYIKKIGSFGVDQLMKEPNRLNDDKDHLQMQTQELAFSNYKTFIQTADCSRELFKRFNSTEETIDSVISRLPKLQSDCQTVAKVSEDILSRKKANSQVLAKNSQILEFLELPQLMDSCIRCGQFEEALELFSYARRLGNKHGKIPVIAKVVAELEGSWRGMVHQLLVQLRADLPLPKCLQIIGFLRRMDVYSDPELRLKFLQARDSWLKSLLSSITVAPGENLSLKKLEAFRVHLFNIVTQYRAIFSDEDVPLIAGDINETSIFYSWMADKRCQAGTGQAPPKDMTQRKISQILSLVEEASSGKQGASLDTVLGQAMYFGLSFSRVGVDFRGLIAPRLHRTVLTVVETAMRRAAKRFEQDMDRYVLSPADASLNAALTSASEGPPLTIMEFTPLAELTNSILRIFNELRSYAPLSTAQSVTNILHELLRSCSKIILGFYRQEQTSLGPAERATIGRMCQAYQSLVVHLAKCLAMLYPHPALAQHLGLPVHQLQNLQLISLKEEFIMEPLNHLLPKQEILSAV